LVLLAANPEKQNKPKPKHTNNYSDSGSAGLGCPERVFPKASLAELGQTRTSCKHCCDSEEGKARPIPALSDRPRGAGRHGTSLLRMKYVRSFCQH